MSQTPFMPLWVSDFLGDTLDLEACEIGAYMLLLMAQWNRDGASLPNDPKKLQRVARCGRNWKNVWGSIERYFDVDESGIYNKRLRLEAQNVAAKRSTNSRNGARGGKAKALKSKDADLANATETLKRNSSIPEPEPYKESTNVLLSISAENDPDAEVRQAVELFKVAATQSGWPVPQTLSPSRKAALRARLKECGGIEGWKVALDKAQASSHCCGDNNRGWRLDFDFITKQASFTKLMEGNYDNSDRKTSRTSSAQPSFAQGGGNPELERIARLA